MGRKNAEARRNYRELSDIFDTYVQGRYSPRQREAIGRLLVDGMNDREWARVRAGRELPSWARYALDDIIRAYWQWRCDNSVPKTLEPKVRSTSVQLRQFTRILVELKNNRDFFKGVFAYYNPSPFDQIKILESALTQLGRVDQLLADAVERIKLPAIRPSHRAVWHALRNLTDLMQRLKLVLDDGPNSIAYPVMYLADPIITKNSLRPVLKEFVANRPKWVDHMLYVDMNLR